MNSQCFLSSIPASCPFLQINVLSKAFVNPLTAALVMEHQEPYSQMDEVPSSYTCPMGSAIRIRKLNLVFIIPAGFNSSKMQPHKTRQTLFQVSHSHMIMIRRPALQAGLGCLKNAVHPLVGNWLLLKFWHLATANSLKIFFQISSDCFAHRMTRLVRVQLVKFVVPTRKLYLTRVRAFLNFLTFEFAKLPQTLIQTFSKAIALTE